MLSFLPMNFCATHCVVTCVYFACKLKKILFLLSAHLSSDFSTIFSVPYCLRFSGMNSLLLDTPGNVVLAGDLQLKHEIELKEEKDTPFLPEIPPSGSPFPLYPLIAPSPVSPFVNISTPKLSGMSRVSLCLCCSMWLK